MRGPGLSLVLLFLVLLGVSLVKGGHHDRTRGFKSQGVSDEEINRYVRHHHHDSVIHRHKPEVKEAVKSHPEVQRYLEWKDRFQEAHPDAGVAFAGKIPHDWIHNMAQHNSKTEPKVEL